MMLDAKIGGITPAMFSLRRQMELWPTVILLPTCRFA